MIIPLVYEPCNPHWAHRAQREKILICVEQAGMSNLDIPVFCVVRCRQVLCGSQKRRHKNSSLCQFDCAMIEKLRDHKRAAALLRAAISLKERQCNSCF